MSEAEEVTPDEEAYEEEILAKLSPIVARIAALADDQVAKKADVEERWYDDIEQENGKYDSETELKLTERGTSKLYVNVTRSKTRTWKSRLGDLIFPDDDKNYGIEPTPEPTVAGFGSDMEEDAAFGVGHNGGPEQPPEQGMDQQAPNIEGVPQMPLGAAPQEMAPGMPEQQAPVQEIPQEHKATVDEAAAEAAKAMEDEIDDQLKETDYNMRSRKGIGDMMKLGTVVMKGPRLAHSMKRKWTPGANEDGTPMMDEQQKPIHQLEMVEKTNPEFLHVDLWDYFPDMNVLNFEDGEFDFERHMMNKSNLKQLAKRPGFEKEAIKRLLKAAPQKGNPEYIARLASIISGRETAAMEPLYQVWEYHGPLEDEEIKLVLEFLGREDEEADFEQDILDDMKVIMWFCDGELLKFGVHPLDSGERLYSLGNFSDDPSSQFGFGIPYMLRDSQKALNAAWRMIMDNSALSSGPQIVVDQANITPQNGSWTLESRKVWLANNKHGLRLDQMFATFNIDGHQQEMLNVIEMSRQFMDDEINLPLIAQGEQASQITQTLGGMSMLMNSANIVFKDVVRSYDDNITVPNIRRLYDFNMQFNPRQDIKGDFDIVARGSSALLVRELEAQNMMNMALNFAGHPVFGPMLKGAELLREVIRSRSLPVDLLVKTDEQMQEEAQAIAEQPPEDDSKLQVAQMNNESREKIATEGNSKDIAMQQNEISSNEKMTMVGFDQEIDINNARNGEARSGKMSEVEARLRDNKENREHKERLTAAEMEIKRSQGSGI